MPIDMHDPLEVLQVLVIMLCMGAGLALVYYQLKMNRLCNQKAANSAPRPIGYTDRKAGVPVLGADSVSEKIRK